MAAVLPTNWGAAAADLLQYYGVNLSETSDFDLLAELIRNLPPESRLGVAEDPDNVWNMDRILAANVTNCLQALGWALGGGKGSKPEPLGPEWAKPKSKLPAQVMSIEELERKLERFERGTR